MADTTVADGIQSLDTDKLCDYICTAVVSRPVNREEIQRRSV